MDDSPTKSCPLFLAALGRKLSGVCHPASLIGIINIPYGTFLVSRHEKDERK